MTLTPRQFEVLVLIGRGLPQKEVAYTLGVSRPTIQNHMASVSRKLGGGPMIHLVVKAIKQGILPIETL